MSQGSRHQSHRAPGLDRTTGAGHGHWGPERGLGDRFTPFFLADFKRAPLPQGSLGLRRRGRQAPTLKGWQVGLLNVHVLVPSYPSCPSPAAFSLKSAPQPPKHT